MKKNNSKKIVKKVYVNIIYQKDYDDYEKRMGVKISECTEIYVNPHVYELVELCRDEVKIRYILIPKSRHSVRLLEKCINFSYYFKQNQNTTSYDEIKEAIKQNDPTVSHISIIEYKRESARECLEEQFYSVDLWY